jgi:hypothetical protein
VNIKLFNVVLGMVVAATVLSASAQKTYTEGVVTSKTSMQGNSVEGKKFFRTDSTAMTYTTGATTIKILSTANLSYFAVLVDVPDASIKKAAIATPVELAAILSAMPKFAFTTSTETKQISGFNCKKVVATDVKTNKAYDVWITSDVSVPPNAIAPYYADIGGFPIKFVSFGIDGQLSDVTVTGVTDAKAPAGTFGISADFDKITIDDLKAKNGGGN